MKKIVLTVAALALSAGAAFAEKPDAEVRDFLSVTNTPVAEQVRAKMESANQVRGTQTDGSANHFGDHRNN